MDKIEEYLAFVAMTASPGTVTFYRQSLNVFADWCKAHNVQRISTTTVNDWTAYELQRGRSVNGIITIRATLRRYYGWCVDSGKYTVNPCASKKLQKLNHQKVRRVFFSVEAYRKVLDICRVDSRTYWYGAVLTGWNTGLRVSDVAMLRWDALNVDEETMKIRPWKVRRFNIEVEIPMDPDLYDYLMQLREHPKYPGNPYVFPDMYQAYMVPGLLVQQFGLITRRAGLPNHSFHSLRHSFISRMLNAGVDSYIVARITGLSVAQIATYAHISLKAKRDAMQKAKVAMMFEENPPQEAVA